MNGKVERVLVTGKSWTAHEKTFYDFTYVINSITYVASHVTPEPKYAVGAQVWFTVTKDNGQYPDKIKFEQSPEDQVKANPATVKKSGSFDNFATMIMAYAKDIAVSRINNGGYKTVSADSIVKDYLTLKEGLEVVKMANVVTTSEQVPEYQKPPSPTEDDDLPF